MNVKKIVTIAIYLQHVPIMKEVTIVNVCLVIVEMELFVMVSICKIGVHGYNSKYLMNSAITSSIYSFIYIHSLLFLFTYCTLHL